MELLSLGPVGAAHMDVRFAQISHKPVLVLRTYILVTEKDDAELVQRGMNFVYFAVRKGAGQIHPADFRADMRGTFLCGDGVVRHAVFLPLRRWNKAS